MRLNSTHVAVSVKGHIRTVLTVTGLARDLGMSRPQASRHLRVLREVGLVRIREAGRQRLYGYVQDLEQASACSTA